MEGDGSLITQRGGAAGGGLVTADDQDAQSETTVELVFLSGFLHAARFIIFSSRLP